MEILILIGIAIVYFLPSLVALNRHHLNKGPITVINFFFGWTMIGWVVCLAWSVSANVKPREDRVKEQKRVEPPLE